MENSEEMLENEKEVLKKEFDVCKKEYVVWKMEKAKSIRLLFQHIFVLSSTYLSPKTPLLCFELLLVRSVYIQRIA